MIKFGISYFSLNCYVTMVTKSKTNKLSDTNWLQNIIFIVYCCHL